MCDAATLGKGMVRKNCHIEVVDSETCSMGMGLITIAAARAVKKGLNLDEVLDVTRRAIPTTHMLALLDTLEYAHRGGRITSLATFMGSLLRIRPLLTLRHSEIRPVGIVRSRAKGIDSLCRFVEGFSNIEDLAIVYSTTPDEAESLAERLDPIFPKSKVHIARIGPALGVHAGPRALGVFVREGEGEPHS